MAITLTPATKQTLEVQAENAAQDNAAPAPAVVTPECPALIDQPTAPATTAAITRRIYAVDEKVGDDWVSHLVRAQSQAQALSFLTKKRFDIVIATADQVATLMTAGAVVQDATTPE